MPHPFSFIRSTCRRPTWRRTHRTRCCIPRNKRDDTPTLRFDKLQRTCPCKHATEHCEETIDANTCRGHTLQDFMTTVPIQLANKKKKRNATKRHKLSTLHTITHTLKTVDSVFGHTCVLVPVIAHPSRPNPTSQQRTSQRTQERRYRCQCGGVKDKTPLTNDQTPSAPSDQILAEKVI